MDDVKPQIEGGSPTTEALYSETGFHGTNKADAQAIQQTGFRISTKTSLHFGNGIYFWAGPKAKELAFHWVLHNNNTPRSEASVVEAIISCQKIELLDLCSPECSESISLLMDDSRNRGIDPIQKMQNALILLQRTSGMTVSVVRGARLLTGRSTQNLPNYFGYFPPMMICARHPSSIQVLFVH